MAGVPRHPRIRRMDRRDFPPGPYSRAAPWRGAERNRRDHAAREGESAGSPLVAPACAGGVRHDAGRSRGRASAGRCDLAGDQAARWTHRVSAPGRRGAGIGLGPRRGWGASSTLSAGPRRHAARPAHAATPSPPPRRCEREIALRRPARELRRSRHNGRDASSLFGRDAIPLNQERRPEAAFKGYVRAGSSQQTLHY